MTHTHTRKEHCTGTLYEYVFFCLLALLDYCTMKAILPDASSECVCSRENKKMRYIYIFCLGVIPCVSGGEMVVYEMLVFLKAVSKSVFRREEDCLCIQLQHCL